MNPHVWPESWYLDILQQRIQGVWAPIAPKISSKSCSFQAILKGKTPILSRFWAQAPPLWSKLCWAPWPKSWILLLLCRGLGGKPERIWIWCSGRLGNHGTGECVPVSSGGRLEKICCQIWEIPRKVLQSHSWKAKLALILFQPEKT